MKAKYLYLILAILFSIVGLTNLLEFIKTPDNIFKIVFCILDIIIFIIYYLLYLDIKGEKK